MVVVASSLVGTVRPDDLACFWLPAIVGLARTENHDQTIIATDEGKQLACAEQNIFLVDYYCMIKENKVNFAQDVNKAAITLCQFAVLASMPSCLSLIKSWTKTSSFRGCHVACSRRPPADTSSFNHKVLPSQKVPTGNNISAGTAYRPFQPRPMPL